MKSVALFAPKNRFSQAIYLELLSLFGSVLFTEDEKKLPKGGVLVYDADLLFPPEEKGDVRIGYTKDASLAAERRLLLRPFPMGKLRAQLEEYARGNIPNYPSSPAEESRTLTATEETLLSLLLAAEGEIVTKQALAESLFPDAEDPAGSVTVYIHYLRKKLEADGRKIILSHRGKGYSIPRGKL